MAIDIQNFSTMQSVSDNDSLLVAPKAGGNGKVTLSVLKGAVSTIDGEQATDAADVNSESAVMVKLRTGGTIAYPATRVTAVVDENGDNVLQVIAKAILQSQITRFAAFGADYDSTTGTWRMHRVGTNYLVTGLSADDMEKICASPDFTTGVIFAGAMRKGEKTNRPVDTYRVVRGSSIIVEMRQMARGNTSLQVFYIPVSGEYTYAVNDMIAAFMGCENLRIVKYLDVSRCASFDRTFDGCTALTECYLKGVDKDLDLGAAANLTQDSLIYIVEQAGTSAKELIFVSSLVTNWQATADYPTWSDFEAYAASKNFTFNHNSVQHLDWDWEQ